VDKYTRITLRIPEGLHARLKEDAAESHHSMNAEIIRRIEDGCWMARIGGSSKMEMETAAKKHGPENHKK
jgi:plasmid stability protein